MSLRNALCALLVVAVVFPCAAAEVPVDRPKDEKVIYKLSVAEAVLIALRSSYQINLTRFDPSIAEQAVEEAWGVFDWIASFTGSYSNDHSRSRSLSSPGVQINKGIGFAAQLAKRFITGTELEIAYNAFRDSTNSTFNMGKNWDNSLGVTIRQPLLRGAGTEFNKSRIRIAQNSYKVARYGLLFQAINVVSSVEIAYWNLVFSIENLKVREESLRLSLQILRENKIKFKHGVIPELEVEGAKANVEANRENITVAWATIRDSSDNLRNLISLSDFNAMQDVMLQPKDTVMDVVVTKINLEAEIQTSLASRPDLLARRYDLANSEINIAVAKNEIYPTVDLEASYTLNGLAGNWGNTHNDLSNLETRTIAAGLTVSVPLENRAARARHKAADLAKRQAILDLYKLEQDIITQVRIAVREVATSQTRIKAREQAVIFARKQLASEQRRKEAGDSTSLDVLRAKEELTSAETRLIEAKVALRIALINLEVAKGTLVTADRVYIAPLEKKIPGLPGWTGILK